MGPHRAAVAPHDPFASRKTPRFDGRTHLIFEPLVFVERLAARVPKPHKNLIIYGDVLAPNAKRRGKVVTYGVAEGAIAETHAVARVTTSDAGDHEDRNTPAELRL